VRDPAAHAAAARGEGQVDSTVSPSAYISARDYLSAHDVDTEQLHSVSSVNSPPLCLSLSLSVCIFGTFQLLQITDSKLYQSLV